MLFGVVLGIAWCLIHEIRYLLMLAQGKHPQLGSTLYLDGTRQAFAQVVAHVPSSIRGALGFFLIIFLLRALLRNQWLAGAGFVLLFTALQSVGHSWAAIEIPTQILIYSIAAVMLLRFGLVTLAVGMFTTTALLNVPLVTATSAWYFANCTFPFLAVAALTLWGLQQH